MSLQTSLDENTGYLECLKDLSVYLKQMSTERGRVTQKKIEKHFIGIQKKQCNKNIGKILDEMYEEYKKDNYVEGIKVGMHVTNLNGSYLGTVKKIYKSGLTALVKDNYKHSQVYKLSNILPR